MQLDQYSPCPCGSGKKLKFCKCVEQPQEYDKLMRLIEGGQELAAMDRINKMLAKTPNAAWLLAVKGELALGMQEIETFKETATRFLKLKPDNPLALIMKSLAAGLDREPVENVANYLLEGLGESRESLPSITIMAIDMLIQLLAASDKLSMAGYWGELQQMLTPEDAQQREMVLQDASLNLIAKATSRVIEDPPGSAWKERLAEVLSLTRTFRFAQAETKLRAILRDFPDQPGPLSHLLRTQMAQLNQSGATTTAMKLAEHTGVSVDDRTFFRALALEIEPGHKSLSTDFIRRFGEVDSLERIMEALATLKSCDSVEGEHADQVKQYFAALVKDEVPARKIYNIFDRNFKETVNDEAEDPNANPVIASAVATVVLFAKETDRPARALFLATRFPEYQQQIDQTLELLQFGSDIDISDLPLTRSYVEFLNRGKLVVGRNERPNIEQTGEELKRDFLNLPFKLLAGATPLEAAKDERQRGPLLGLLSHLEGEQSFVVPTETIDQIYQQLELQRPAVTVDQVSGGLRIKNILDLDRIKLADLSDQHVQGLMFRAMNLGASRAFYHSSLAVRSRPGLADQVQSQMIALTAMKMFADSIDKKIEYSRELLDLLTAAKQPVGKIVIEMISMLHAAGRSQEAESTLIDAAQKYPDDPYLMSFLQYVMQSQRGTQSPAAAGLGPDQLAQRMMQHATRPEPEGSGLVLPGQSTGAPQGESKLWLPGS